MNSYLKNLFPAPEQVKVPSKAVLSPMFYTRNCYDIPSFRDDALARAMSRLPKVAPVKKEVVHVEFRQGVLDLGSDSITE